MDDEELNTMVTKVVSLLTDLEFYLEDRDISLATLCGNTASKLEEFQIDNL